MLLVKDYENSCDILNNFKKDGTNPDNRTERSYFIEKAVDYIKTDGHGILINILNSMPGVFT